MSVLRELVKVCLANELHNVHVSVPGKVIKYEHKLQRAQIKPLSKLKIQEARGNAEIDPSKLKYEELDLVFNVPVHHLSCNGGAVHIHMPIKPGDLGMLNFTTHSMEKYLLGEGKAYNVEDSRTHNLTDGFFIPGVNPFKAALNIIDADKLQIVNDKAVITLHNDGTVGKIAAENSTVELVSSCISVMEKLSSTLTSLVAGLITGTTPVGSGGGGGAVTWTDTDFISGLGDIKKDVEDLKSLLETLKL